MADQAALDQALADLTTHVASIATGVQDIINKLVAAALPIDLNAEVTAVQGATASLQASSDAIAAALAPPAPAPEPPPAPAAPVISAVSPDNGPAGTSVVIAGSGFDGASAVSFGGAAATSFSVDSDAQITAVCGGAGDGTGSLTVDAPGGTASGSFTVTG